MHEDTRALELPSALRALMAELGPRWGTNVPGNVRAMIDAFTPLLATAPKGDATITADIPYGEHPRQKLDVFSPNRASSAPVILFVHGGAFVDGERNRSPEIYANVLHYFARHHMVGVNMEYRLAPEFKYPSGVEDVRHAVAWTRANIERFGGDPERVFLFGHSAGAAHAAGYAYDKSQHPEGRAGIAGLIVVSGRVRADNSTDNPNARKVEAYYGMDATRYSAVSPVSLVAADSVPTMIAFAEFENPLIDVYCLELAHRLALAKKRAPTVLRLPGHNHTSMIAHMNTAEDQLGCEIRSFIEASRAA